MADRVERTCDVGSFAGHIFAEKPRDGDECRCGAVKWADLAQARAEPPPDAVENSYGLSIARNTGGGA